LCKASDKLHESKAIDGGCTCQSRYDQRHQVGRCVFRNQDLAELAACIDWGPFFQTRDLAGPFPAILRDEIVGAEEVRVFSDGKRLLQRLIEGRWLQAHGVVALLPANTVDDDTIEVYADESRQQALLRWSPLRLQTERLVIDGVRRPNRCLADYDNDSAIMLEALADRLAEAFAERLHQRVRTELWGYAADEALAPRQAADVRGVEGRRASGLCVTRCVSVGSGGQPVVHPGVSLALLRRVFLDTALHAVETGCMGCPSQKNGCQARTFHDSADWIGKFEIPRLRTPTVASRRTRDVIAPSSPVDNRAVGEHRVARGEGLLLERMLRRDALVDLDAEARGLGQLPAAVNHPDRALDDVAVPRHGADHLLLDDEVRRRDVEMQR
jgi:hypothetical protein